MKRILFRAVLIVAGIALVGCQSTNLHAVKGSGFMPEEDEKGLWLRSGETQKVLDNSGFLYSDPELDTYLDSIARKLLDPVVFTQIPLKVRVIKNPYLNAFSMPNGLIYVHTGIIARMESEAELAALLAHEMTHCTHRHAVKEYRDAKNKTGILASVAATLGGYGGLVTALGSIGTFASIQGYSRELETEADMVGIELVIAAGYDPHEAAKLFRHLQKATEEEDEKDKAPFFFSSHPMLQERIENYKIYLNTHPVSPDKGTGIQNKEVFLEKTKGVVVENAVLDLKAGRFKSAEHGIRKYLAQTPNDARGYYLLGELCRQQREQQLTVKAKEHYQRAIALSPSYPEPYKGLGLIYFKAGDWLLANQYMERYLELKPDAADRGYIEGYLRQCKQGSIK